ncbi:MAG: hypothetical protein GY754_19685 [bacterium]|nr:hypothetical protein [bacterium]
MDTVKKLFYHKELYDFEALKEAENKYCDKLSLEIEEGDYYYNIALTVKEPADSLIDEFNNFVLKKSIYLKNSE